MLMYQIFVRNFSEEGTFRAVISQLGRIKELGTDIIWLAPVHPIGRLKRKGSLGSPYAISDYRAVNPEYGSLEDFKELVSGIHAHGMKCIIDVVYNHTSPDSVLSREHPEWFYHREDGSFGNRVGDWTDVIDLDYSNAGLWDYQIETLKMWAETVDGFRCDVASLVPVEFWERARREVEEVRPGALWLAESVHPGFITHMRSLGLGAHSDCELYRAFDICYDYDIFEDFTDCVHGKLPLSDYAKDVNRQEYTYPENYVKLRFLENHDQPRASSMFRDENSLRSATAFMFFQKGTALVYAGQEIGASHLPGLFDRDPVDWNSPEKTDLSGLIRRLAEIKKDPLFTDSSYSVKAAGEGVLFAVHRSGENAAAGVFPIGGRASEAVLEGVPDGIYNDLISGDRAEVKGGRLAPSGAPLIFRF